jgi:hypothetical protein
MMPFRYHSMQRKEQLLELLDPEHEVEFDATFLKHLAAAIRASRPSERQRALDKATQAYENALEDVLYENGGILLRKAEHDARWSQNFSGQLGSRHSG